MRKIFSKVNIIKQVVIQTLMFMFILLTFSLIWCMDNFGNISMEEIVFTLNMPLKGASTDYFYSYFIKAFLPTIILFALEMILWFKKKKKVYILQLQIKDKTHDVRL